MLISVNSYRGPCEGNAHKNFRLLGLEFIFSRDFTLLNAFIFLGCARFHVLQSDFAACRKGMNESVTASPQPDNEGTTNIAMTEIKVTDNMSPSAAAKKKCSTTSEDTKLKYIKFCEVLILTSVMVVVIGLSLIPTVFFLLPSQKQVQLKHSSLLISRIIFNFSQTALPTAPAVIV